MGKSEIKLIPITTMSRSMTAEQVPSNIEQIGVKYKWSKGYTGKGNVIALIDTGCDVNHPDLADRVIGGYNFTNEHNGNISVFNDTNGHGTHVAGIIAGSINRHGIVGVAPNSKLLILKVLNSTGGGSIGNLIDAIHYAIDWIGPSGEKVKVISLSLGTKYPSADLHTAIKRAVNNNIPIVAASGNDGDGNIDTNEYRYPAAYEDVIEVGAIDSKNQIAFFSNTNQLVDIYAPGVNIQSTFLEQKFANLSGTSMAAPHVAGVLSLLIEEYESVLNRIPNEEEIFKILMKHTRATLVKNNNYIHILSLKKMVFNEEAARNKNDILLKCFCEARKTQAYFTKCLDENSTIEERNFMLELVKDAAKTSNKIKDFCLNMVD